MESRYINRDLSWLSFNERVLREAAKPLVPLLERLRFLAIYSSNLDEFYRVRMPAILALDGLRQSEKDKETLSQVEDRIDQQLQFFGGTLTKSIIPELQGKGIELLYNRSIPSIIADEINHLFYSQIAAFLQPVFLSKANDFFPENNKIYLVAAVENNGVEDIGIVCIPSLEAGRFASVAVEDTQYIVIIDDVLRAYAESIFQCKLIGELYSIKVTRDAELNLDDEYKGDMAENIAQQIAKRDFGLATRFLYDAAMPVNLQEKIRTKLKLEHANTVSGGRYHNLKDLANLPVRQADFNYDKWPAKQIVISEESIWKRLQQQDVILHTPYHSFDTVLRFFNESALDQNVTEIYITLYRVADDSHIAQALISAAKNGKSVTVFVELKARFDEANNLRWAERMSAAGVRIIYSIPELKVHAKVALVKRKQGDKVNYYGLFSTGNFNESTARFYTDHVLLTANAAMLRELEALFAFLCKRRKPIPEDVFELKHLLVAQFNLLSKFTELIDYEIAEARAGKPALMRIKLNNLEEKTLVEKLYEASQAGVQVELIIRGICTLKPGVVGKSENITVRRIVDRYLEHGRLFYFHHSGEELLYLGSADWLNRNIYRRIEVCFPIYDSAIKEELKTLLYLQYSDNIQAVLLDDNGANQTIDEQSPPIQSQKAIYKLIDAQDGK